MPRSKHDGWIATSLLLVVLLWGGGNTGTKWLVMRWPPIWAGAMRFVFSGWLLVTVLRMTSWLGEYRRLSGAATRQLWGRGGLSLAAYIIFFNWALRLTAASHVSLYIGASPVWTLLWEERPRRTWASARRYGAAMLALAGVMVLFAPVLRNSQATLLGELCGFVASILWANLSHQLRILGGKLSGAEVAAHTMWMAGLALAPLGLVELTAHTAPLTPGTVGVLGFCIVCGSVIPYALWNNALRHWRTSQVVLFNNLIPLSTMMWAHFVLGEPVTPTFWTAMVLIILGVLLGQWHWTKIFGMPEGL